jgi:acetolactate synthase-1/2/3 large subunit
VIIAGSDVYAGDAVAALREAAESLQIPVFTNGMGRGSLPPNHPLAFTKARRAATKGADVIAVVGTPLDFRLSFGDFGDARVVHIVDAPGQRAGHVQPAASPAGDLRLILSAIADFRGTRADHADWVEKAAPDRGRRPRGRGGRARGGHRPHQAGAGLRRAAPDPGAGRR